MDVEKIKITFDRTYMVISTFCFTYEGNGDFWSLVTENEAVGLNKKYGVTQGNQIFRLSCTNIDSNMYIIAKAIEAQITN